jgi:hypothetical protein
LFIIVFLLICCGPVFIFSLLGQILVPDPKKRMTLEQVKRHPWMAGEGKMNDSEASFIALISHCAMLPWCEPVVAPVGGTGAAASAAAQGAKAMNSTVRAYEQSIVVARTEALKVCVFFYYFCGG